jgi:hypothetical protein
LYPHNAEALSGRRLHHDPSIQAVHDLGTELFQAAHLGCNVVGLNINVNATFMFDFLDLHDGFVGWRFQHAVIAAATGVRQVYWATERLRPEASRVIYVGSIAINQYGTQA